MTPFKPRTLPLEIEILRILDVRMGLSPEMRWNYLNLEKGFAGEIQFDSLIEKLQCQCYVLNDLLLKVNNTIFQIDTTLIFQDKICPIEGKNYEEDFTYYREYLESPTGKHYRNPVDQLNRTSLSLEQLLQSKGHHIPIEGKVVFVNPEFTLYNASKNEPIIFPTQLNKFMRKLDSHPSKLNGWHKKMADLLVSLNIVDDPYPRLPPYTFEQLKKGIMCRACHSFEVSVSGCGPKPKVLCGECGCVESIDSAVLRCVRETKILFPGRKMTTTLVAEWCNYKVSNKVIYRVLKQNFKTIRSSRWVYYE